MHKLAKRVEEAIRPKPMCRDCADHNGRCGSDQKAELCDPVEMAKEIAVEVDKALSASPACYVPISKQQLLDCRLNVFAIDLLAESFLKLPKVPDNFAIFFPVNRSDCAEYSGINIRIEAVNKKAKTGT